MRFGRIARNGQAHYVRFDGDRAVVLTAAPWEGGVDTSDVVALEGVRLLAPVTPSKIVCVGKNYAKHAAELGSEVPKTPLLFLKPDSAVIGPGDAIELPSQSARVEHEAELAVVIGRTARNVPVDDALSYVFGYTCANDVTARDLQRSDVQFTRAKSFDTFCPLGPVVATGLDPHRLDVSLRVGDDVRQDGNTRDMVFSVATLISFISTVMTLRPGDVILTGTPEGVGPLVENDRVSVTVEGVGTLVNVVRLGT